MIARKTHILILGQPPRVFHQRGEIHLWVNMSILRHMSAELIRVNEKTKTRLQSLKEDPRETYCDVIERLIRMAIDDEPLSDETLKGIEEASDRKLSIEIA